MWKRWASKQLSAKAGSMTELNTRKKDRHKKWTEQTTNLGLIYHSHQMKHTFYMDIVSGHVMCRQMYSMFCRIQIKPSTLFLIFASTNHLLKHWTRIVVNKHSSNASSMSRFKWRQVFLFEDNSSVYL